MPYHTCFAGLYFSWINSNPYYLWYGVKIYEKIVFSLVKNRVEGTAHPGTRSEQSKRTWRNGNTGSLESIEVLLDYFFWWVYMTIYISLFLFGL